MKRVNRKRKTRVKIEGRGKLLFVSHWHQSTKPFFVADIPSQFADEAHGYPGLTRVYLTPFFRSKVHEPGKGDPE